MTDYSDIKDIIKREFHFLTDSYGYRLKEFSAPSINGGDFSVLEYLNDRCNRIIEIRFQTLQSGYPNLFAVFKKIVSGVIPNHQDNTNYLTFNRIKSYYKNDKWKYFGFDFEKREIIERIGEFGKLLKENDEFLDSDNWFSHDQLIKNEKDIYVFDSDWKPKQWIQDAISRFKNELGSRIQVSLNSDEIEPYENIGDTVEFMDSSSGDKYKLNYGWKSRDTSAIGIAINKNSVIESYEIEDPNIEKIVDELIDKIKRTIANKT